MDSIQRRDWANLPTELWHCILKFAACNETAWDPATSAMPEWIAWLQLACTLGSVNRSLRDVMLGSEARPLWTSLWFCASYPGMSAGHSSSLNRLQMRQCRARSTIEEITLHGGGWVLDDLRAVCASMPQNIEVLMLVDLQDQEEGDIIDRRFADASIGQLLLTGAPPVLALSCLNSFWRGSVANGDMHRLDLMLDTPQVPPEQHDSNDIFFARLMFTLLLPLCSLRVLIFCAGSWIMTSDDVQLIRQQLPLLQCLDIMLHSWPISSPGPPSVMLPSQQSLRQLKLFTKVQLVLSVCVFDELCSLSVLAQVHDVPMRTLRFQSLAPELTPAEEDLLALCCSCKQLVLKLADPHMRLQRSPSGVEVLYE